MIQPQDDLGERGGAVVVNENCLGARDGLRGRVEPGLDGEVRFKLPVVRPWPAAHLASAGVKSQTDGVGQRHVAPDTSWVGVLGQHGRGRNRDQGDKQSEKKKAGLALWQLEAVDLKRHGAILDRFLADSATHSAYFGARN